MQIKIFSVVALSSLVSLVNGVAVNSRDKLDIFSPRIISPNARTIWVAGKTETVTWDTSNAPVNISNGGAVYLNTPTSQLTLAKGFDLRSGAVDVNVPILPTGLYNILLFGDSGNKSPEFFIVNPN